MKKSLWLFTGFFYFFICTLTLSGKDSPELVPLTGNGVRKTGTKDPVDSNTFFEIGIGFGGGSANGVSELFYDRKNIFGTTFSTDIAFRFSERWRVGIGLFLWAESWQIFHNDRPAGEDTNNTRFSIYLTGSCYPLKDRHFFLDLGTGAGNFFFTPDQALPLDDGSFSLSSVIDVGFASTVGIGYEIKVSKKLYLVPSLRYHHTWLGDFDIFPGHIRNSNPSRIIGFHIGLMMDL